MSCVIKIDDGYHSVLIPGDIERASEYAILHAEKKRMAAGIEARTNGTQDNKSNVEKTAVRADVLIAPHHGSKTSSTDIWIQRVSPDVVLYTQDMKIDGNFQANPSFLAIRNMAFANLPPANLVSFDLSSQKVAI